MKQRLRTAFLVLVASLPTAFAYAQTIESAAARITEILEDLILPLLFVLATVVFIWGVILYITAGGSEDKAKKGRTYILWGLVGLAVMVGVWGLVRVLLSIVFPFGNPGNAPGLPDLPK